MKPSRFYFGPSMYRIYSCKFNPFQAVYYSIIWRVAFFWEELKDRAKSAIEQWKHKRKMKRILKDPEMRRLQRNAGIKS